MIDLTCDDASTTEDIHRVVHSLTGFTAHLHSSADNVAAAHQLRQPLHQTRRSLQQPPIRIGRGATAGSGTCR
ncbi:hypothetical protein ACFYXF_04020 [Streptomyces sp. NPDC002680]|uniref:hypothetical protein n=1 Tax=Streptomyces sp. NPDC002680 TaxID=3364659 RepID=UPI0036983E9D